MHEIRFCRMEEKKELQDFIKKHWKDNHVFTYDTSLLDNQHLDKEKGRYNFIIAENKQTHEIDAILGFIPTSHYDSNSNVENIWLAIWKVKDRYKSTGIGLELYLKLQRVYANASVGVVGISEDASKIYKAFRYKTGYLDHFYIKNNAITDKGIMIFDDAIYECKEKNVSITLKKISFSDLEKGNLNCTVSPFKTKEYFLNKYLTNGSYNYLLYGFFRRNQLISVFVARIIRLNESKCMRIVDWMGSFPKKCHDQYHDLIVSENCEYVDMLCHVPNKDDILDMGFYLKNPELTTIPNYFEPFVSENIDIRYAFKSHSKEYFIFKGDSDQDRPNITEHVLP